MLRCSQNRIVLMVMSVLIVVIAQMASGALVERIFLGGPAQSGAAYDIFSMRPDGTDLRNLSIDTGLSLGNPRISPDGTRIAYGAWDGANHSLWMMNPDGSNKTLVRNIGLNHDIRWFDNNTIAYSVRTGALDSEIRSVNVNGTNDSVLVSIPMLGQYVLNLFDFAPDRRKIAIGAQVHGYWSPNEDIYLADVLSASSTANHREFYADTGDDQMDRWPAFSRDGNSVFWMLDTVPGVETPKALVRKAVNGSSPVTDYDEVIRPAGANGLYMFSLLAVSPDGSRFVMGFNDDRTYIWDSVLQTDTLLLGSRSFGADWGMVVPEPASMVILGLGGIGMLARRRGLGR